MAQAGSPTRYSVKYRFVQGGPYFHKQITFIYFKWIEYLVNDKNSALKTLKG